MSIGNTATESRGAIDQSASRDAARPDNILSVRDLKMHFSTGGGLFRRSTQTVKAVDGVSFDVERRETFGLVGESGCGKTTTARLILRAYEPTGGSIMFSPQRGVESDLATAPRGELWSLRDHMHMVFQDPYASLNPRMTVEQLIAEPLIVRGWRRSRYRERVTELLSLVGLDATYAERYPHAFSGGQRQRIAIARALALNPALVVADEPVSALDVSVQAQIINLLEDLQTELGLTYVFIAHDLSLVRHITDNVAVMYLGRIVETGPTEELFLRPAHPYTEMLLASVPVPDPAFRKSRTVVRGEALQSAATGIGCSFADRCPFAQDRCREIDPPLERVERSDGTSRLTACIRASELDLVGLDAGQ
ncbi:MAG: ATP-binding cassette domain-containing protein [Spirochaetaceae bacterium]|nr:MAG: ATP-binding cassette domain-containing protein [Spirochaetaceae bacterium]